MKFSSGLEPLLVDIESVTQDPDNARAHNQRNMTAIEDSLRLFGQQKPVVIDQDGIILAGNGTHLALKKLGWSKIAAVKIDLPREEAIAFAIADNRTAELANWDREELSSQLQQIKEDFQDLEVSALGFSEKEMEALINNWGEELEDIDHNELPEYNEDNERYVIRMDNILEQHIGNIMEIAVIVLGELEMNYEVELY